MPRMPLLFSSLALVAAALTPAAAAGPTTGPTTGFGRFGRDNDDGLLTLNVTPAGFAAPPGAAGPPLRVRFGDGTGCVARVLRLDATGKTLVLRGGGPGAPARVRYSLLYPGFAATFGPRLELAFSDDKGAPVPVRVEQASSGPGRTLLLVRRADGGSVTVAVVLSRTPGVSVRFPAPSRLVAENNRPLGEVRFVTPLGLDGGAAVTNETNESAQRREADFWENCPLPTRLRTNARLSPDGRSVTITDTFAPVGRNETAIAPLPPVLAFAVAHGYPAKVFGKIVTTRCRTKYGPFAFVRGHVLRYTLPVPPTDERGYVRAAPSPTAEKYASLLNDLVGHLGGDWAANAVDLGYAGMTNATLAWAYLTPGRRGEVSAAWRRYLPLAFRLPPYTPTDAKRPWKTETEPLSGQTYLWTYHIDGPGGRRYDLDWGNALPLYGLSKYAQYSGDWGFVRRHWADVQRIYRYFDGGDDWAWMTVVNADHGYSTGTGDPLAATFCGTLACLKMARTVGDRAAEKHFAVRAARVAVPAVARFWYTPWARRHGFIGPTSVVLGFHETEGFTRARLGADDPWDVTTLLSGDGVLPELFAAYQTFAPGALAAYEAEYARSFPDWFRSDVRYPFPTTYDGNSVYVTFPHLYARALLGEPDAALWRYADAAQKNRNNAWIGPNVIAELLSRRAPLVLTGWLPAAYRDGFVSPDGRRVTLDFRLAVRPTRWTLTAVSPPGASVRSVRVNGKAVSFTFRGGRLIVSCQAAGAVHVVLAFGRRKASGTAR